MNELETYNHLSLRYAPKKHPAVKISTAARMPGRAIRAEFHPRQQTAGVAQIEQGESPDATLILGATAP
jgi:hypothetical protein